VTSIGYLFMDNIELIVHPQSEEDLLKLYRLVIYSLRGSPNDGNEFKRERLDEYKENFSLLLVDKISRKVSYITEYHLRIVY
jgi:hypothetical protein